MPVPAARAGPQARAPIVLEDWQREIVEEHPGDFLRGLFHSDGCRVNNWATRIVAGQMKRYDYPRWMFVNRSDDILDLCTATLDAGRHPVAAATGQLHRGVPSRRRTRASTT